MSNKKRPIIILTPGRSGSSYVSSLLIESGVHMGDNLIGSTRGNSLGHFEDSEIVTFHIKKSNNPSRDKSWEHKERGTWGFKDPRTPNFLSYWYALYPKATFVVLIRNPEEYVSSLMRRDGKAQGECEKIYNSLMNKIIRFLKDNNPSFCLFDIDEIRKDEIGFIQTINEFGYTLTPPDKKVFVKSMFHTKPNIRLLTNSRKIYEELIQIGRDNSHNNKQKRRAL